MIDFDKLFEEYMVSWYKANEGEFENPEQIEDILPNLYNEWADTASPQLGGIAPREFFANITELEQLMTLFLGTSAGESNPCSLLLDRILQVKECMPLLQKIISGDYTPKQKQLSLSLYNEMGGEPLYDVYASWIIDKNEDSDLKEFAALLMSTNPDEAKEALLKAAASDAVFSDKLLIADILSHAKKDERIFVFLEQLLDTGINITALSAIVGRYGDERSAAKLYKMLDSCNYAEYVEVVNAIERLGGVVDEDRDFSDDEYYKRIKGTN